MKEPERLVPEPRLPVILAAPPRATVLVAAPHPDDEACGLGGTLALHARQGDRVFVEFLTSGATGDPEHRYADIAAVRRREAEAAAALLGLTELRFWNLPDNHRASFRDIEAAAARLAARATEVGATLLYHPWPGESHSDHRATALAARRALELCKAAGRGYEVWSPLPARFILDITPVLDLKRRAIAAHASQVGYTDYLHHTLGLNAHRGLYLPRGGGYAEAFV